MRDSRRVPVRNPPQNIVKEYVSECIQQTKPSTSCIYGSCMRSSHDSRRRQPRRTTVVAERRQAAKRTHHLYSTSACRRTCISPATSHVLSRLGLYRAFRRFIPEGARSSCCSGHELCYRVVLHGAFRRCIPEGTRSSCCKPSYKRGPGCSISQRTFQRTCDGVVDRYCSSSILKEEGEDGEGESGVSVAAPTKWEMPRFQHQALFCPFFFSLEPHNTYR